MSALDRRLFLRAALGVAAAAACGLPLAAPADAATLPVLKPGLPETGESLAEEAATIVIRRRRPWRRRRARIVIRPRRRRRCWRNRRGRLVCVIR